MNGRREGRRRGSGREQREDEAATLFKGGLAAALFPMEEESHTSLQGSVEGSHPAKG